MAISIKPSQYLLGNLPTTANKTQASAKALTEALAKTMPGVIQTTDKQSPEQTAKNILNHVQNGLNQLRSQGANSERLEQRLAAAQEGIEKGYKQATEILKGLGLYDDELKEQVEAGRKLVDDGMAELAKNIKNLPAPNTMPMLSSSSLSTANSLSLQVLTREGDRVTVRFDQAQATSSSSDSFSASLQQSWSMEVEGSLSDAEQKALSGLFNDVQSLSERFFAGDIGSALEQAMGLGYDGQQLAAFSLNLTQKMSFSAVQSPYAQVREQLPTPELERLRAPLASYVDSYMNALDKAKPLANPMQTFQDLIQQLLPEESRMPVWQAFHEGLNKLL